ncbi:MULTISPECIES: UMP kinase [unclassified Haloferax]|uniref:UMP kinase n=1 Tax=Haloferax sp. Atlit-48N TaxID=2077198 RepID=A0ACD5I455_9EURY|nr:MULTISPECIES: UMP kinase [unclassified Haloferax]RDZ30276.1 UMP kinase [Haloferax sp. Atlit-48N]RDZ33932.1 UMP kinase [Haloferax sp. Atlit-24N]RDZ35604.1 UMP kinase [Haloferax sp. Atlit-47N]RLM33537.1 UMP kinase [Haloferax sp. Atlit-109R]RLM40885.1 UMP kinase [Haloferax sp. Atlit-105R]
MRIVLSLGGSILVPTLDLEQFREYAAVITTLAEEHDVCVVTGGGSPACEFIDVGRALGANEVELDQIGIGVTRVSARLLIAAIGDDVVSSPSKDYEAAGRALRGGDIVVMGGTAPGQTTDAVSALLAEYINAELLIYATNVTGVFSADPHTHPDAEPFNKLRASQLVELILDIDSTARGSVPIGILAAKIIQRANFETVVIDGTDPEYILSVVRSGELDGTRITSDGDDDTPPAET